MYKLFLLLVLFLYGCSGDVNYREQIIPLYPLSISGTDTTYFKLNSVVSDSEIVEHVSFKYFNGREYKIVDIKYSDLLVFGSDDNNKARLLVGYHSSERFDLLDIFDKLKDSDNEVIYELLINYKYLD